MFEKDMPEELSLKVLSWNILAHIHTHWDAALHTGSQQARKCLETQEQAKARHSRIVQEIRRQEPDIALLQEVDSTFMPSNWQAASGPLPCGEKLDGYTPYRSYKRIQQSIVEEGTVVLLRDATLQRDKAVPVSYFKGSSEHGCKTGIVVHASHLQSRTTIALASVHLRHNAQEQALSLLRSVICARNRSTAMILGGDFNLPTRRLRETVEPMLHANQLYRVPTPAGKPTGMHSLETIDHIYVSPCLELCMPAIIGPIPLVESGGPWGPGEGHNGSDHAWMSMELNIWR